MALATKQYPQPAGPTEGGLRVGIDLGGTKTEIAVLDAAGKFLLRKRAETPRGDYRATIDTIVRLLAAAEQSVGGRCTVGIGIPGAISPATGRVRNANSEWLNGQRLQENLEEALARPVRIQNDANCLAVSEATDGAAAGAHCVLGVILGTGVGAGICIGGQVLTGRNAIAGEWGHNPLPSPPGSLAEAAGPRCWCGRIGCIEAWLSGPALARDFVLHDSQARAAHGTIDAREVCWLADQGDTDATQAVERWLDRLARGLAGVINILDPDVIVVGGGLSNAAVVYRELPRRWGAHIFSDRVDTVIVPAAHGDSSGVRGAAWLW